MTSSSWPRPSSSGSGARARGGGGRAAPRPGGRGLARRASVERGFAIRVPKAYPIYDVDYAERVRTIRGWLDGISNLQQVGRNGLHRYNNSDHSMLTAMRAVENITKGTDNDLRAVNDDSAYNEEDTPDEHPYRDAPETPSMKQPVPSELS